MFKNKSLLILFLSFLLIMSACSAAGSGGDDSDSSSGESEKTGTIVFDASFAAASESIIVTVKDANGNVVVSSQELSLDAEKKSKVTLPVGTYRITKFLSVDGNNAVLHVVPSAGSAKAAGLDPAKVLPLEVTVAEGKNAEPDPEAVQFDGSDAQDFGFLPFDLEVVDTTGPDVFAPFLRSVEVVTPQGGINETGLATILIEAEDIGSGVKSISAILNGPVRIAGQVGNTGQYFDLHEGVFRYDRALGKWKTTVEFIRYHENGTWRVDYIELIDKAGNERVIKSPLANTSNYIYRQAGEEKDSGITLAAGEMEFTTAFEDTAPPVLKSISAPQGVINRPGLVAFQFEIEENGAGLDLDFVEVDLLSPSEIAGQTGQIISLRGFTYNENTGILTGYADFKTNHESGTWQLGYLSFTDLVTNERFYFISNDQNKTVYVHRYDGNEVDSAVPLSHGEVEYSSPASDITPPELVSVSSSVSEVVGTGSVTFTLEIIETGSGLDLSDTAVYLDSPKNLADYHGQQIEITSWNYNQATGELVGTAQLQNIHEAGSWRLSFIDLCDNAGNLRTYQISNNNSIVNYVYGYQQNETDSGIPVSDSAVEHIPAGEGGQDILPVLRGAYVNTNTMGGFGERPVFLSIKDGPSGSANLGITAVMFSPTTLGGGMGNDVLINNFVYNEATGLWQGSVQPADFDENGTWLLGQVTLEDTLLSNTRDYIVVAGNGSLHYMVTDDDFVTITDSGVAYGPTGIVKQ